LRAQSVDVSGLRFGVVVSDYHPHLADQLLEGSRRCFASHGIDPERVPVFRVPGVFEISQAASRLLRSRRHHFDAMVCLGVLIRGETSHFDVLAAEVSRGIGETARRSRVPLTFGVLTVESEGQARDRANRGISNKGWEAAQAAIRMAVLFRHLEDGSTPPKPGRRFGRNR